MTKIRLTFFIITLLSMGLTSCDTIKKMFTTDLEDEDFIIGQLYADELVDEKPFVPIRRSHNTNNGNTDLGVDITNPKLAQSIAAWFGTPYLYGGCDKNGVDCSCFVGNIYKEVYRITLKRTANDIFQQCSPVAQSKLTEGDLVFFTNSNGKISHVGIFLCENTFVHSSTSHGVSFSKLTDTYWSKHFYKGGRIK